jgi:hypothetical protein
MMEVGDFKATRQKPHLIGIPGHFVGAKREVSFRFVFSLIFRGTDYAEIFP